MSKMKDFDYSVKVLIVGDGGVGKTSLTRRFATGQFTQEYIQTIGVNLFTKIIEVKGQKMKMHLWDTGGQEKFRNLLPKYYEGGSCGLVVYDVTKPLTLKKCGWWVSEITKNRGKIPLILIGNKTDLDRQISTEEGQAIADKLGIPLIETSAKDQINVENAFSLLGEMILENAEKQ
ncbi:MAG: GTP-binding protein [Candidatus Freyarchaeum deiterrae]